MKKRILCVAVFITVIFLVSYAHFSHTETYNSAVNYVADGTTFIKKQVGFDSEVYGPRVTLHGSSATTVVKQVQRHDTAPSNSNVTAGGKEGSGHTDQTQYKLRHDKECPRMRSILTSPYSRRLQMSGGVSFFTKFNDEYHFLYCSVPKVGSTNWKRMMIVLTLSEKERAKLNPDKVNNMKNVHNDPRVKALTTISMQAHPLNAKYSEYFKFVLFRHPFTRMVSAWRNKFHSETINRYFYKNYGIDIMKITRGDAGIAKFYANQQENLLTFREFVVGINNGIIDRHWSPQSEICLPCQIDYSYVGFFEYLTEDTNFIWDQIGVKEDMIRADQVSENGQLQSTTSLTRELFNNLTKQEVADIYSFYEKDFMMFGYDKDVNSPTFPYPAISRIT